MNTRNTKVGSDENCPLRCPLKQNQMTQKSDNQNNTLQGCDPIRTSRQVVLRFVALYFKRIHILQTSDIC